MATASTRGTAYIESLDQAASKLRRLARDHFDNDDVCGMLVREGARLETFVKATWFPAESPRRTLNDLVGLLPATVTSEAQKLHEFRRAYNAAKHDPLHTPGLLELDALFGKLREAVVQINALRLGVTDAFAGSATRRLFWLAAWDHFTGGDTEIHFMFPSDTPHWLGPPEFDLIYIDGLKWDDAKAALQHVGDLRDGAELIPERFLKLWRNEDDFLDAFVFEGEYRELLTTIAQFEVRQDLIAGLNRGDRAFQTWAGVLLASVDCVSSGVASADLAEAVIARATSIYALPEEARALKEQATAVANLLAKVPPVYLPEITGPIWMDQQRFDELRASAHAHSLESPVLVDQRLRLVTVQAK